MHQVIKDFLGELKKKFPDNFKNSKVCEMGSLNINGSVRPFFENCEYIGVDWREGPDVDMVSFAHEFKSKEKFDVVISCEMLEHDKYSTKSIWNMINLLKPGGLLIITCAANLRKMHELNCGVHNYYKNLSKKDLLNWVYIDEMKEVYVEDTGHDLHFWGLMK